ncbi:MAG: SGNH/GDSL hydrolase family protein [Vicinamibacterales bacterium]
MRPRSTSRARLWLVAGSLVLALAMTEVGLRLAARWLFIDNFIAPDPVLGWVIRPGFGGWVTDENNLWVQINSEGFRDRERSIAPPPHTLRVAVMGDSFIHGYFVPLEQTYSSFLEQGLAPCAARSDRQVEVLNFGVLGYGTTQELLTYRYRASRYSPNIVVLAVFTQNDIYDNHAALSTEPAPRYVFQGDELVLDNSFRTQLPAPSKWPLRRRLFEYLTTHSRTIWLLNSTNGRIHEYLDGREGERTIDVGPEVLDTAIYRPPVDSEMREAWKVTEALLLKFSEEVRANGAEFWIVTLSNTIQIDPDLAKRRAFQDRLGVDSLFYPDRRIAALAKAHGIPVVSLAEPLSEYTAAHGTYLNGGKTREVPFGEGHWNEVGNRIGADLTAKQMCTESGALGRE